MKSSQNSLVPRDHLLRSIDRFVDLSSIRSHLAPFYSYTGRPSIDPELMIRMLLIGYCCGIRSERQLCYEVTMNLAYRWFCKLSITDKVPDHSTFSKNRHGRFRDSEVFRFVFEQVIKRCMEEGLIGGEGFAVDASVIEADASRFKRVEDFADLYIHMRDQSVVLLPMHFHRIFRARPGSEFFVTQFHTRPHFFLVRVVGQVAKLLVLVFVGAERER